MSTQERCPLAQAGNTTSESSNAPELGAVPPHLVSEGALRSTEGFGDGAVGDLPIFLPHADDGVGLRVKLAQTGEEASEQVAVCHDALNGRSLVGNHVQQSVLAVLPDGNVQRSLVSGALMLTGQAVSVTGPDILLRADAASVGLCLHTDAGRLAVVGIADFLADRNLGLGLAVVDKWLVVFGFFHQIFLRFIVPKRGKSLGTAEEGNSKPSAVRTVFTVSDCSLPLNSQLCFQLSRRITLSHPCTGDASSSV